MSDVLELSYQLAELPSAQHRAGLAGLVLCLYYLDKQSWFNERQKSGAIVEFDQDSLDEFGVTIRLNEAGLKALFDYTYDAFKDERSTQNKVKDADRIEEKEITDEKGKVKTIKIYHYSVLQPKAAFLPALDLSSEEPNRGLWIKLWRDMVWNIVRGVPATRNPFVEERWEKGYTKDSDEWKSLQKSEKSTGQTGQYFLGSAAINAENVPTKDQVKYQFLLHFWVFVSQVYCPMVTDSEGKPEQVGYAIAVPDVANLSLFCEEFCDALQNHRNNDPWPRRRFLPREAVIDVPEESALDLLRLLKDRIGRKGKQLDDLVLGAEIIQAEKVSTSGVKIRSIGYVEAIESTIDRYSNLQRLYWCHWFRKQRLLNLLRSQPDPDQPDRLKEVPAWIEFDALLSRVPRRWLQDSAFSHDARMLFEHEVKVKEMKEVRDYAKIVYKVCQGYVLGKLASKYDLTWDECKGNPKKEKDYNEKKEKVVNEAFLSVRSRTDQQAFIDYFVSSLYPRVKESEFVQFAEALYSKTDEIRALTLLALSSQFPLPSKDSKQAQESAA
ncbi:type I-MYXAN CRISPR-associated protein Cmx8 [Alkalinema pantanalense CENA528]|uniref:type I-MYXAN CRISPR-associated protein Cmx8 n=1 Tax=Alkalinema pantanalense TaxID=1620705 RepID=UPI003D6E0342